MNRIKIALLMIAAVLTLNSCFAAAVGAAAGVGGYYCGKSGKCTNNNN